MLTSNLFLKSISTRFLNFAKIFNALFFLHPNYYYVQSTPAPSKLLTDLTNVHELLTDLHLSAEQQELFIHPLDKEIFRADSTVTEISDDSEQEISSDDVTASDSSQLSIVSPSVPALVGRFYGK